MKRVILLAAVVVSAVGVVAMPASAERPKKFNTVLQVFEGHTTGNHLTGLSGELRSSKPPCVRVRRSITISPALKNGGRTVHIKNFGGSRAGEFSVTLKHAPYWKPGAGFNVRVAPYRLGNGQVCKDLQTIVGS